MKLQTLKDADIAHKTVLLRVDYNVPLRNGKVADDTRIKQSLPTLKHLVQQDAKIIIMSHLGRPKGEVNEELRLTPVADHLSKLLDAPIIKVESCIGADVEEAIKSMKNGQILMLENTRFHAEEKKNDPEFAKKLASYADVYVSDAFGTVHRAHASTEGVAHHLPAYAGFLIEKEIAALSPLLEKPEAPFVLIMGGAKIDTKIGVIKNYLEKADKIIIGGGLANTFLLARGFDVGASLCEKDKVETAQDIMLEADKANCEIVMPEDVIAADEISDDAITADANIRGIEGEMQILDIGEESLKQFVEIINEAATIIWNGPVGLYEKKPFEKGTREIAWAVKNSQAKTYLGGGDTVDAIKRFDISPDSFTHVSTGGGAMLEFLEGKDLPGLKVLKK
ncbi:phosphoglycerate kinase [Patescibacteria group bacterium]